MKKVFMMVALVMTCTTGSLASETVAENVSTAEMCSLSAKKTTKKQQPILQQPQRLLQLQQ